MSDVFNLDPNELAAEANTAREVFLDALVDEDIMEKSDAEKIKKRYALILVKPSWLGRIFRTGTDKEKYFWKVIKLTGPEGNQFPK